MIKVLEEKEKKEIQKEQINDLKKSLGNIRSYCNKNLKKTYVKYIPSFLNSHYSNGFISNDEFDIPISLYKISRKQTFDILNAKIEYKLLHGKSVYYCGNPRSVDNSILVETDKSSSIISGLIHCNSIYQCNVCQQRILARKQLELETINDGYIKSGGSVYLVSLTVKHDKTDSFEFLLGSSKTNTGILGAYSYLVSKDRKFQNLLKKYNVEMSCRAFESTWGKINGFHAHIHALFYMKQKLTNEELNSFQEELHFLWSRSVDKVGLKVPNIKHGVNVKDGSHAGKYIAKWSCSNELSSGQFKEAKNGNYTINQLEQLLINKEQTDVPLNQLKKVLSEYYKGCVGKRFLTWSDKDNLRKRYLNEAEMEELDDEDILENSDIKSTEKVLIDYSSYMKIKSLNKVHDLRSSIELFSFQGVLHLAKNLSIPTYNIHFVENVKVTEDEKIKRIIYFNSEFGFFPEYGENIQLRDYFVLNYHNLLETAFAYYTDNSILVITNSYYNYVLDFCEQYQDRIFHDNS